jgi:plasmid stability protein
MPNIQVKNVPDDVHAVLRRRAAAAGQSLQEYLLAELTRIARAPTVAEVVERVGHRSGGRLALRQAESDLREDRRAR